MRHAGMGWPNGPAEEEQLWSLPGSVFLLLDSERWHLDDLRQRRPDALVLQRALPGTLTALEWDPARIASSVMRHWGDYGHDESTHLIPHNELNLNYERGDSEDDWAWEASAQRYADLAELLAQTAGLLREEHGFRRTLHFPAWSPHQWWQERVERWAWAVDHFDVLDFHAYGTLDDVRAVYGWLRGRWPTKPLCLTEWHGRSRDDVDEERRVLGWLAQVAEQDPAFLGATYFIWRWFGPADGHTDAWDVEANDARTALFRNPPTQEATIMNVQDLHRIRWDLMRDPGASADPGEYHADWGIEQFWLKNPQIGSPITGELQLDDGTVGRVFTNAVVVWTGDHAEIAQ